MATGVSKTKWQASVEATSPVLSSGISLTYADKATEWGILETCPAALAHVWSAKPCTSNSLYFGDNLPILAALLQRTDLRGKVKLIYIDPPYATNSVFQSRAQADAYQDLLTGASYVEFLRTRLVLLRELLAEDGSIYVHLDDKMAHYIKVVMDEVFGASNFRNWITRRKCSHKNYTKKTYGNISDYILFYTKSDAYTWNRPVEEWTVERAKKEYPCIDPETGGRYKKVPIHAPGTRNGETGKMWRGMLPPPGKHWQYTPQTLEEMDARGEIYWSPTGNPRRIVYLEDSEGVAVQDIWQDFRDTRNQNVLSTGYPTEKNPEMLAQIIRASSNPGDLVLDCFCGSGVTLAAAEQLGRRWIGIDNSAEAITTVLKRFLQGVERMGNYVQGNEQAETPFFGGSMRLDLFEAGLPLDEKLPAIPAANFDLYTEPAHVEMLNALVKRFTPL